MRYIMLACAMLIAASVFAANWQTYNNLDHVYDVMHINDDIYISTWGGMMKLRPTKANPASIVDYAEDILYNTGTGLASNDIRSMANLSFSNSLWLGTSDAGVSILSSGGIQNLSINLGLPSVKVNRIIQDQSTVLVATSAGLAVFYYLEGVNFPLMLHQYNSQNTSGGLLGNDIEDMVLTEDGVLFVATEGGVSYIPLDSLNDDSQWSNLHTASSPIPSGVSCKIAISPAYIAVAEGNNVYIHAADLNSGSWQTHSPNSGLSGDTVSSLAFDGNNKLYISYGSWDEDVLYYSRINDTLLTTISTDGSLANWSINEAGLGYSTINRICNVDGVIYLCSWGEGLYQAINNAFVNYAPPGIGFPKITQITTDKEHAVWFTSGNLDSKPTRKGTMGVSKLQNGIWQTYNIANSPIQSDNILTVGIDHLNRKWFGTWDNSHSPAGWDVGVTVYDESNGSWKQLTRREGLRIWDSSTSTWGAYNNNPINKLTTSTIAGIYPAANDLMMVMCYDGGIDFINENLEIVNRTTLPNSPNQKVYNGFYSGNKYFFGTYNNTGMMIWNHNSIPQEDAIHWLAPEPPELNDCILYGVVTIQAPYGVGNQHWIAASSGLFMWDGNKWYKYDTMIKRFMYNSVSRTWQNNMLYYEDEERLFGSVRTTPTSILLDPFNRIWIGSLENGLSMYNPETERFTNFFKPNVPLLTNYITTLGYDPVQGNLMIGTPDGLNTLKIGRTIKPPTDLNTLSAFPNPFRPKVHSSVQIVNLPEDSMPEGKGTCSIYDASGMLVVKLDENRYSRFEWNGKSTSGQECASGIYFFVVADEQGNTKRGKFALLR